MSDGYLEEMKMEVKINWLQVLGLLVCSMISGYTLGVAVSSGIISMGVGIFGVLLFGLILGTSFQIIEPAEEKSND